MAAIWHDVRAAVPTRILPRRSRGHGGATSVHHSKVAAALAHPTA